MDFDGLADRALIAVIAHLGSDTTYQPGAGPSTAARGVFDEPYVLADVGQTGISSSNPSLYFRLADLPSDPEVDEAARITRRGVTYRAIEVEKDGHGGVLLRLRKV